MDSTTLNSQNSESDSALDIAFDTMCSICHEIVDSSKNCVITECSHTFCLSCLIQSLKCNNKCPLCRKNIEPNPDPTNKPARMLDLITCVPAIEQCFEDFHAQSHLDSIILFERPQAAFKTAITVFGLELAKRFVDLQRSDADDVFFEYESEGFNSEDESETESEEDSRETVVVENNAAIGPARTIFTNERLEFNINGLNPTLYPTRIPPTSAEIVNIATSSIINTPFAKHIHFIMFWILFWFAMHCLHYAYQLVIN
jgi:hypothetical protein